MFKRALAAVVPAVVFALPVSAATIDFGGLAGSTGDPLGTYNEDGFTVTSLDDVQKAVDFGNPAPAIRGRGFFLGADGTSSFSLTASGGATFFLSTFDMRPGSGPTSGEPAVDYEVIGTLNGSTVFDLDGQATGLSFLTFDLGTAAALVDTVTFSFLHRSNLYVIDNIVVALPPPSEVPEPATLALLGLGLAGLAATRRRRA